MRSTVVFGAGATQSGAEAGLQRQLRRGVERSGTERRSWRCNPAGAERRVAPAPKTAVRSTGTEAKRRKRQSQTSPAPGQTSEAPNGGRQHPTALGSRHFSPGAAWFGRRAEQESQWSCVQCAVQIRAELNRIVASWIHHENNRLKINNAFVVDRRVSMPRLTIRTRRFVRNIIVYHSVYLFFLF